MNTPSFSLLRCLRGIQFPVALLLCFLLGCPVAALADGVPHLLNYQGRVAVDGQNFTGTGYFKFALVDGGTNQNRTATATASVSVNNRIAGITITDGGRGYVTPPAVSIEGTGSGATFTASVSNGAVTGITVDAPGSGYAPVPPPVVVIAPPPVSVEVTTFWTQDGTELGAGAKEPVGYVRLPVAKGLYSVLLGDQKVDGMTALDAGLFAKNSDLRLRVWFSADGSAFTQLTPDQRIAAVAYALMAGDVPDGAITSEKIADGAITASKLAAGGIQLSQLTPELQQALTVLIATQQVQVPYITSAATATMVSGSPFTYTITATGNPSSFGAAGLPSGLTRTGNTISGLELPPGAHSFTVTASNIYGTSAPKTITLTVIGPVYADFSSGLDTNAGTSALPVKTLQHALDLANSSNPDRNVYVSTAAQTTPSQLSTSNGMVVSGGRNPATGWTRAAGARTPLHRSAGPNAGLGDIIAFSLNPGSALENFDITVADASASFSSVGVQTTGDGQRVTGCRITPGRGGPGYNGDHGIEGVNGYKGIVGGLLNHWVQGYGARNPNRPYSSMVFSKWLPQGGDGGGGSDWDYKDYGFSSGLVWTQYGASTGFSPLSGTGIPGGTPGMDGLITAGSGGYGADAPPGIDGSHAPSAEKDGQDGQDGQGGAGGGGGGAILMGVTLTFGTVSASWGGGGGGGGEGGQGGEGGRGGRSGGHSIAIFVKHPLACIVGADGRTPIPTNGYLSPILEGNILRPRNGGAGGNGGNGAWGGNGGLGAPGWQSVPVTINGIVRHPGSGGHGGWGGSGGNGGGGGGGRGGNSYGIFARIKPTGYVPANSPYLNRTPSVTQTSNTFELGLGGAAGIGGLKGGFTSSRAPSGNAGFGQNFIPPNFP